MQYCWKSVFVPLTVLTLLASAGCGGKEPGEKPPQAAIGASGADPAASTDPAATSRPVSDPRHPVVLIDTSLGSITVRLDAEKAPITVDNFLSYVRNGHYDQTIFHQVLKGYAVLGGTYTVDLVEKKARTSIRNEAHNGLKNRRGTIAMARQADGIDSATSQFYINVADNPMLDHKQRTPESYGYCVFGEVIEGMDVVDKIAAVPVEDKNQLERTPVEKLVIQSIRRVDRSAPATAARQTQSRYK